MEGIEALSTEAHRTYYKWDAIFYSGIWPLDHSLGTGVKTLNCAQFTHLYQRLFLNKPGSLHFAGCLMQIHLCLCKLYG